MNSKLNVGVIGLGRLGTVYAKHLVNRVPNANLVAVADSDDPVNNSIDRRVSCEYPGKLPCRTP